MVVSVVVVVVDLRFLAGLALVRAVVGEPLEVGEVGDGGAGLLAAEERVVVGEDGSGNGLG
jgi:hypothetical protein